MIRKAKIKDAKQIHALIAFYAKRDEMLPRPLSEIYENIRDFFVYEENDRVYGCGMLHIIWEDLAEIKSLAVVEDRLGKGIGSSILKECINEAEELLVPRVFVLTYKPDFFKHNGFEIIDRQELPQKVWSECVKCPKFPDCGETALVKDLRK